MDAMKSKELLHEAELQPGIPRAGLPAMYNSQLF
jgi:hypothetical protein